MTADFEYIINVLICHPCSVMKKSKCLPERKIFIFLDDIQKNVLGIFSCLKSSNRAKHLSETRISIEEKKILMGYTL